MKNGNVHRMQKSPNRSKKESGDQGDKSSGRKKPGQHLQKRRGGGAGGADDDDSSVDSRGNVRGLIAYSEDEESSYESSCTSATQDTDLTPEQRATIRRHARKAALKARKRIQRTLAKEQESSPHGTRIKKKAVSKRRVIESESESEDEKNEIVDAESSEESDAPGFRARPKKKGFLPRRKRQEESDESEEEESEEESEEGEGSSDESEEDDSEEDYDADSDEEEDDDDMKKKRPHGISISFGLAGDDDDAERMIPKRHNLKKESSLVRKFVKLVTEPVDTGGIDDQIDQFKALPEEKQKAMVAALEKKATSPSDNLMFRILSMNLSPETQAVVMAKYHALQDMDPGSGEYFKLRAWVEKFASLPLGLYREMPVRMDSGTEACGAFMEKARRCLAEAIYGQEESKLQILQFIASKIANPDARGLSLLLAGPPGIGKTSLIKNGIAKALEWPFQFISLGGDSDASTYTGHQVVYEGSHCGKIVNSIVAAKSMSMVLMFDELDKISATPKGEEVQNMLVHLTDPVQNGDFEDKYLSGIPIDLSKVMFVFSGNDLNKIDKILMDRMIVIELKGYEMKEKLAIAENFLLPQALRDVRLDEKVSVSREILEHIIKDYAGKEPGVRELKRAIEAIVQKINMLRIFNTKDLPFHIPEFSLPFVVKKSHVDLFLKKKEDGMDESARRMYT